MPDTVWIVQFLVGLVVSGLVYDRRQLAKEHKQLRIEVAGLHSQHATVEVRVDALREILELKIDNVDKNVNNVLLAIKELSNDAKSDRGKTQ